MNRVGTIGVERRTIGELHDATMLIAVAARREILADPAFEKAGYLALELANLGHGVFFLLTGHFGSPAEGEDVDAHAVIVALAWWGKRVARLKIRTCPLLPLVRAS